MRYVACNRDLFIRNVAIDNGTCCARRIFKSTVIGVGTIEILLNFCFVQRKNNRNHFLRAQFTQSSDAIIDWWWSYSCRLNAKRARAIDQGLNFRRNQSSSHDVWVSMTSDHNSYRHPNLRVCVCVFVRYCTPSRNAPVVCVCAMAECQLSNGVAVNRNSSEPDESYGKRHQNAYSEVDVGKKKKREPNSPRSLTDFYFEFCWTIALFWWLWTVLDCFVRMNLNLQSFRNSPILCRFLIELVTFFDSHFIREIVNQIWFN